MIIYRIADLMVPKRALGRAARGGQARRLTRRRPRLLTCRAVHFAFRILHFAFIRTTALYGLHGPAL
jgi:hypothetical protein